jgi:hypothetical protein
LTEFAYRRGITNKGIHAVAATSDGKNSFKIERQKFKP